MEKRQKRHDIIGIGCGILVLLVLVAGAVVNNLPAKAGVKDSELPVDALTLIGTAPGRNGDVTVRVVATEDKLWQIEVTDHIETDGYGTLAARDLPVSIFESQSLAVDAVSGATITSEAILDAIVSALNEGGFDPAAFGAARVKAETVAARVESASGVSMMYSADWAEQYPEVYASWEQNRENSELTDYLVDYPMLKTLYEPFGFSKDYKSAHGHVYTLHDIGETKRVGEKTMASCFTCKTPEFTHKVNEEGVSTYAIPFAELKDQFSEPISCYNCHANTPGTVTITHTYLTDGVGEDFEKIDANNLACGQCHVEYYFDAGNSGATALPHNNLDSMEPDAILAFFNDGSNFPNGEPFADFTNPRTGVRQIKVQHPELETYLAEGSVHRDTYTCADCHMGETKAENGKTIASHYLTSPLKNEALLAGECAECHTDLVSEIHEKQAEVDRRIYATGYQLEYLTEMLAAAVESGDYSEDELNAIRTLARDAQFYWDYVFVENSEGAHNFTLTHDCLDKTEALCNEALNLFKR
ncbi:MAG: ammonia-forming cytochrome c nitrite reductase subunit c552 [Ruminococcaceae bacterium]|nr:ammonia-forming cytochrome c nitrite reductase subunit c552 [Oscillospiraceae bacterium]